MSGSYDDLFERLLRRSALNSRSTPPTAQPRAATSPRASTNTRTVRKHVMRGDNPQNMNVKHRQKLLTNIEKGYYKTAEFYGVVDGHSRRVLQASHPCLTRKGLMLSQEVAGVLSTRLGRDYSSLLLWHSAGSGKTFAMVRILFWWCLKWWGETPPYSLPLLGPPTKAHIAPGSAHQHLPRFIFIVADDEQLTNMIDTFDLFETSKLSETLAEMRDRKAAGGGASTTEIELYNEQIGQFFASMPSRKVVIIPIDSGKAEAASSTAKVPNHFSVQNLANFNVKKDGDPKKTFMALGNPRISNTQIIGLVSAGYFEKSSNLSGGDIEDASALMGSSLHAFFVSFLSEAELKKGAFDLVPSEERLVAGSYMDICTDFCRQNTLHPSRGHLFKLIQRESVYIYTWTDRDNAPTASALQTGDFVRFVYKNEVVSPLWYVVSTRRMMSTNGGGTSSYIFQMTCLMTQYDSASWFKAAMPLKPDGTIRSDFKIYDILRFNIPIQCRMQRVDQTIVSQAQMSFPYSQLLPIIRQAGGELSLQGKDAAAFWGTSTWWIPYNSSPRYRGNKDLEKQWRESVGFSVQQMRGKTFHCPTTLVIGILPEKFAAFTQLPKHSLVIVDEIQKNTDSADGPTNQAKNPGFVAMMKNAIRVNNCYSVVATATPYSRDLRDLGRLLSCIGREDVTFSLGKPGELIPDSVLLPKHRMELARNLSKSRVLLSFVDLDQDASMLPTLTALDSPTAVVDVIPSRLELMRREPTSAEDSIGGEIDAPDDKKKKRQPAGAAAPPAPMAVPQPPKRQQQQPAKQRNPYIAPWG